jgi:hypothetical protein
MTLRFEICQQHVQQSMLTVLLVMTRFVACCLQGKHMSEQLVTRYQAKQQLPVAIVRPSLVSAIAGGCRSNSCTWASTGSSYFTTHRSSAAPSFAAICTAAVCVHKDNSMKNITCVY